MDIIVQEMMIDNLNKFHNSIKSKLELFLHLHDRFLLLDLNKLETINKKKGESKKEFVQRLFREDPIFIINNLIDIIDTYLYSNRFDINPRNIYYRGRIDKKIYVREKIVLHDIKYLTEIKSLNVEIRTGIDFDYSVKNSNFYIESMNCFSHEIVIFGEIEFDELADDVINYLFIDVNFEYVGLKYNNNLPIWIEYIIEGVLYQNNGNMKLAVFNYFVSFDCFIQTVYNQIHKYYNKKDFEESIKRIFDEFIDNKRDEIIELIIEEMYELKYYDEDYDELYDEIWNKEKNNINENIKGYLDSYDEMFEASKIRMKDEYEFYSRQDKRLIDQKLKDIEKLLDINLNTTSFSGLSRLKKSIKVIEKNRNHIAHGNDIPINITGNEFYEICTYIISIILNIDFDKTYWRELILL